MTDENLSPESLIRYIKTLKEYFLPPLETQENVQWEYKFDICKAIWNLSETPYNGLKTAVSTYSEMLVGLERFNRWASAEGLQTSRFHAGIDSGPCVVTSNMTVGTPLTVALQLVKQATLDDKILFVSEDVVKAMGLEENLKSYRKEIDLTAVVENRRRGIYGLDQGSLHELFKS